jgi:hypothetical protein
MIICSIILSPYTATQITPKLCIDCKYYTKKFFTSNELGKCSLFRKEDIDIFLINGVHNYKKEYYYCSTTRMFEDMCGKEGKFYKKNKK